MGSVRSRLHCLRKRKARTRTWSPAGNVGRTGGVLPRDPRTLTLGVLITALVVGPSSAVQAAPPDPANAAVLGTVATLFPIGLGAGLLASGRGADDDARFTAALTSISVGAVFGPTTGQLYAGAGVDAVVTLVLRAVTGGLSVSGLGLTLRGSDDEVPTGAALFVVGGLTTLALAVYDILETPSTAREARIRGSLESHELDELYSVAVCGPFPCPAGDRSAAISAVRGP